MPRCPFCHRRLLPGRACPADGAKPQDAAEPGTLKEPPVGVPNLCLTNPIGRGGFSEVWAGQRRKTKTKVAVKFANTRDSILAKRFQHEARALHKIGPPHVPEFLGHGEEDGRAYLIMEHISWPTLADVLATRGLEPDLMWGHSMINALLDALIAVHKLGFVHRDLKPENIFVSTAGTAVKLIDFGLVREIEILSDLTQTGAAVGTPSYMAPEQLRGELADARSDIYAVGVILYELVTGRPPFVGPDPVVQRGHLALRPKPVRDLVSVTPGLNEVILACLSKAPEKRPQTATTLKDALKVNWTTAGSNATTHTTNSDLGQHSKQPVVLVFLEGNGSATKLSQVIKSERGVVCRHTSKYYLCAFSAIDTHDPASHAVAAATKLSQLGWKRAVLHVTKLRVQTRNGQTPRMLGTAISRPESWIPNEPWEGLLLSEHFSSVMPAHQTRRSQIPGFKLLLETAPDRPEGSPLLGRKELMDQCLNVWRRAVVTNTPSLITILGAPGMGKSRVCRELAQRIGESLSNSQGEVIPMRIGRSFETTTLQSIENVRDRKSSASTVVIQPGWQFAEEFKGFGDSLKRKATQGPLAVVIDQTHIASDQFLDQLEFASLDGESLPLLVVACADPSLQDLRPDWGKGAGCSITCRLGPLSKTAATMLTIELLKPVEYPPTEFVRQLVERTGGHPYYLTEMVRQLKHEGLIKRRAKAKGAYVAADELDRLPPSQVGQWLLTYQLGGMMPELASFLRLCSVVGVECLVEELEFVQDQLQAEGLWVTGIDAAIGLAELADLGILTRTSVGYAFQSAVFQHGVYELLEASERKRIHRCISRFWELRLRTGMAGTEILQRIAWHRQEAGEVEEAAALWLELGYKALGLRRPVEAERYFSSCLRLGSKDELTHAEALVGRGRARQQIARRAESAIDLEEAERIAMKLGNLALAADAMLECAITLDSDQQYRRSAAKGREAKDLVQRLGDARLEGKYLCALGREAARNHEIDASIYYLTRALEKSTSSADEETQTVIKLILGVVQIFAGSLDESRQTFDELIELCERRRDGFHLAATYINRLMFWEAMGEVQKGVEDLERVIVLTREFGHPRLERMATHNLAVLHYIRSDYEESLRLAQRSKDLMQRFDVPVSPEVLLLARVHLALGHSHDARELIEWVKTNCPPETPEQGLLLRAIDLVILEHLSNDETDQAWQELLSEVESLPLSEEMFDVYWWRAKCALSRNLGKTAGQVVATVTPKLAGAPAWRDRFAGLQGSKEPNNGKDHIAKPLSVSDKA